MILDFLNKRINHSKEILQVSHSNNKKIKSLTIDALFFDGFYLNNDIRNSEQLKDKFDELKQIKNPVLYWFEIDKKK